MVQTNRNDIGEPSNAVESKILSQYKDEFRLGYQAGLKKAVDLAKLKRHTLVLEQSEMDYQAGYIRGSKDISEAIEHEIKEGK